VSPSLLVSHLRIGWLDLGCSADELRILATLVAGARAESLRGVLLTGTSHIRNQLRDGAIGRSAVRTITSGAVSRPIVTRQRSGSSTHGMPALCRREPI
jgi:hypothetical protein